MTAEGKEHFIQTLHVHDAYAVKDLDIPIGTAEDPRHLLLTGPNGSGKSTILKILREHLRGSPAQRDEILMLDMALEKLRGQPASSEQRDRDLREIKDLEAKRQQLAKFPGVTTTPGLEAHRKLLFLASANRKVSFKNATGPKAIGLSPHPVGDKSAEYLLQYLVNLRTEAALAREDGDTSAADELTERLGAFEEQLRSIFGEPDLQLMFDRSQWRYWLRLGDGRDVEFRHLPDGFASVLYLWASLLLAAQALQAHGPQGPVGWALLDEPELHLHAELQEKVLPFLGSLFPRVQFIVATHSPAVLASLSNATVFDLRTREAYPSEDLRGVRYGTILTEHFGISSDFDLETTRALRELYGLYEKNPKPGSDDFKKMRALADALGDVPHILVPTTKKLTSRASDE